MVIYIHLYRMFLVNIFKILEKQNVCVGVEASVI